MKVRFRDNLGTADGRRLHDATGYEIDCSACRIYTEHEIPEKAGAWLVEHRLADEIERRVRGVAKQSEITAPEKQ